MGGAVDLALIQTFVGLYPPVAARARGARCTADSGAWGGRMGKRKSWERNGGKSGGAYLRNFPTIQTMIGQEMQRKGVAAQRLLKSRGRQRRPRQEFRGFKNYYSEMVLIVVASKNVVYKNGY
jgi:hypothetical protein